MENDRQNYLGQRPPANGLTAPSGLCARRGVWAAAGVLAIFLFRIVRMVPFLSDCCRNRATFGTFSRFALYFCRAPSRSLLICLGAWFGLDFAVQVAPLGPNPPTPRSRFYSDPVPLRGRPEPN